MKNSIKKFQKNMMAAAFAEASEWDTAKEMAPAKELARELNWVDRIFTAVTFAESGMHDEAIRNLKLGLVGKRAQAARKSARSPKPLRQTTWLDRVFLAVTFAESGLHGEAIRILEPGSVRNRGFNTTLVNELGLKGVQLMYGTVSI